MARQLDPHNMHDVLHVARQYAQQFDDPTEQARQRYHALARAAHWLIEEWVRVTDDRLGADLDRLSDCVVAARDSAWDAYAMRISGGL